MENLVLVVHLVIALCLIGVVLLQRSEGGALGMGGGGGGGGGLVSARGAATALSKVTWVLAVGFICTSISLTVLSGGRQDSVFEAPAAGEVDPLLGTPLQSDGQDGDVPVPSAPSSN